MVRFIVDSTSYINKDYARNNNIEVVQLSVELDDARHDEGYEADWDNYFERLKSSKSFPKTSQPTPDTFVQAINNIWKTDKDADIIIITLSQSLSGTYNSACLAQSLVESDKVHVLDSGQTAQSMLLLIKELVELEKDGHSVKDIIKQANTIKEKIYLEFVPSTMEYLKRGGRLNLLSATIASVLNIKPILSFKQGSLTNTKKVLGMPKAIAELVANVPANIKKLYVIYIHESAWLNKLVNKVSATLNIEVVTQLKVGPVIGSHLGVGAVGLAYITD